jgi:hypothetical protein
MNVNQVRAYVILPVLLLLAGDKTCLPQSAAEVAAASALANQFETVVYSRTETIAASAVSNSAVADATNELALPFSEMIAALRSLGQNTDSDLESTYVSVLVGAADFAGPVGIGPGPDGLGMVNSRKCYIAVLGSGRGPDLEREFKGATSESIGGRQAWTWMVPQYEGSPKGTKFYATQVSGSYMVFANNQPDIEEIVNALTASGESAPLPQNVPGWDTFTKYDYWAYRQFRRVGVKSTDAAGLRGLATEVSAISFYADVEQRSGFIQVFGSNTNQTSPPPILRKIGPEKFQLLDKNVWQAEVPLSKDEAGVDAMFEIFYRLGFGVAV